jgi:hypothetical protein
VTQTKKKRGVSPKAHPSSFVSLERTLERAAGASYNAGLGTGTGDHPLVEAADAWTKVGSRRLGSALDAGLGRSHIDLKPQIDLRCKSHDLIQRSTSDQLSFTGRDLLSVVACGSPTGGPLQTDSGRSAGAGEWRSPATSGLSRNARKFVQTGQSTPFHARPRRPTPSLAHATWIDGPPQGRGNAGLLNHLVRAQQ